jgi:hypothetical protein
MPGRNKITSAEREKKVCEVDCAPSEWTLVTLLGSRKGAKEDET